MGCMLAVHLKWLSASRAPENTATNFYVGVMLQSSEPTRLVQHLLANLTGSVVNVTQQDCQNQRMEESDTVTKHVSGRHRD